MGLPCPSPVGHIWGFNDSDNSDPLWIARYNDASNQSELRVNIGDDYGPLAVESVDSFVVGVSDYTVGGQWRPVLSVSSSGVVQAERFQGDGSGLSGTWLLGGNSGTTPGTQFLGTTDNNPLELKVNGQRAMRLEPSSSGSVNVIAGSSANSVAPGVLGATIAGGGNRYTYPMPLLSFPNTVNADFGTVSGGNSNTVGAVAGTVAGGVGNQVDTGADIASIGGGADNAIKPGAAASAIGGGQNNLITANAVQSVIGGGVTTI